MKNDRLISRLLHILVFVSFLTPFFFVGCDEVEEAPTTTDSVMTRQALAPDSIVQDTIPRDTLKSDTAKSALIYQSPSPEKEDGAVESIAYKITKKYHFTKPFLVPDKDTYSGLAIVVDTSANVPFFAIFNAVLFLVISLVMKYMNAQSPKMTFFHLLLAFIFLSMARPISFDCKVLWGYWICLALLGLTAMFDFWVLISIRKRRKAELS
jgi:hypothetical protein